MHTNQISINSKVIEVAVDFLRRVAPVGAEEQNTLAQVVDILETALQQNRRQ